MQKKWFKQLCDLSVLCVENLNENRERDWNTESTEDSENLEDSEKAPSLGAEGFC